MLEPPERRAGDEEISGPSSLQRLQVTDRVGAPGRMVAGVGAMRVLREVLGVHPLDIEQVGIALADDEHPCTGRDDLSDNLPDPGDEPLVG